jgi:hypothetical protein
MERKQGTRINNKKLSLFSEMKMKITARLVDFDFHHITYVTIAHDEPDGK